MERRDDSPDNDSSTTKSIVPPEDFNVTRSIVPNDDVNVTRTISADAIRQLPTPGQPSSPPNYEIVGELGRGGMGVVYKAKQSGLNRDVALKMVLAGGHATATERVRFLAEAEAIAIVQHSGIVQIFEFGTHLGLPYFAMEFVTGGTLAAKLAGTPMPARDAAAITAKIARAIHAAHEKGIIHRDLKPSNILLTDSGEPKISDFGLARTRESGSGLTQTGAILGSPSYMSPEQADGKHHEVGPLSDVYSISAILYECLTGRPPFRAATPLDTVLQVIKDEPVPPSKLASKVPTDVETICLKALSKDPAKRYASAAAFAEDLDRYLAGEPILARPPNVVEKYVKSFRKRPLVHVLGMITCVCVGAFVGLLNASNNNLRKKQMLLEKETEIANAARQEADTQKRLAAARLDKALEAVDQMMIRVAGEKWALKPELQQERRDVLEEAIAFYQSLNDTDSKDPAVRLQTARANLFAAASTISLGEYNRARELSQAAQSIGQEMRENLPDDPRFMRIEAEAFSLLGHTYSIQADFSKGLTCYDAALELAKKACLLEPANDDNQILRAECHSSLALFYSFQRPDLSRKHHEETRKIANELLTRPLPSYRARLLFLTSSINLATGEFQTDPVGALEKLQVAEKQIPLLDKMTPPNARSAETFITAKAGLKVYRGLYHSRRGEPEKGLEEFREGIELIRRMLTIQPKSFPHRVQLIQFQSIHADMLQRMKRFEQSKLILAEVDELKTRLVKDQPQLSWVQNLGNVQKTLQLIEDVRRSYRPDFEADCDRLLNEQNPAVKYNVACIYAQAYPRAPNEKREAIASKATALLEELLESTAYFTQVVNIRHLDDDTDLDPIRQRPEFQAFRKRAFANLEKLEGKKGQENTMPPNKK